MPVDNVLGAYANRAADISAAMRSEVRGASQVQETGLVMGMAVQVEQDPLAELQDAMEELSMSFEEKATKTMADRKVNETQSSRMLQMIRAIARWQSTMPDMPGQEFLERMLRNVRFMQNLPTAQQFLKMLREGSSDPSHLFAMLECLESALGDGETEIAELFAESKKTLMQESGEEVRAGFNIAREINERAGSMEEMQGLRDLYRGEVLGFETPQDCFTSLMEKRGAGRLEEAIDFLMTGCSLDMEAADPSMAPEELRRIQLDLQCVQVLKTVQEKLGDISDRTLAEFGEKCLLNGEQLTGKVIDMTKSSFNSPAVFVSLVNACGLKGLLTQNDFMLGMTGIIRDLSPRMFKSEKDRLSLVDAAQDHLDHIVSLLEQEEAEEEDEQ